MSYLIDLAGCDVAVCSECDIEEALIVAKIKISLYKSEKATQRYNVAGSVVGTLKTQ